MSRPAKKHIYEVNGSYFNNSYDKVATRKEIEEFCYQKLSDWQWSSIQISRETVVVYSQKNKIIGGFRFDKKSCSENQTFWNIIKMTKEDIKNKQEEIDYLTVK